MNAERFIEFCRHLLDDSPRPVFIIVERSSAHTAKAVADFVTSTDGRLKIFFLRTPRSSTPENGCGRTSRTTRSTEPYR
jgi:hypothetical protein